MKGGIFSTMATATNPHSDGNLRNAAEEYSNALSGFQYDKAKEVAEKERSSNNVPKWKSFFTLLSNLAIAERQYINLNFIQPKKKFFSRDVSNNSRNVDETIYFTWQFRIRTRPCMILFFKISAKLIARGHLRKPICSKYL